MTYDSDKATFLAGFLALAITKNESLKILLAKNVIPLPEFKRI